MLIARVTGVRPRRKGFRGATAAPVDTLPLTRGRAQHASTHEMAPLGRWLTKGQARQGLHKWLRASAVWWRPACPLLRQAAARRLQQQLHQATLRLWIERSAEAKRGGCRLECNASARVRGPMPQSPGRPEHGRSLSLVALGRRKLRGRLQADWLQRGAECAVLRPAVRATMGLRSPLRRRAAVRLLLERHGLGTRGPLGRRRVVERHDSSSRFLGPSEMESSRAQDNRVCVGSGRHRAVAFVHLCGLAAPLEYPVPKVERLPAPGLPLGRCPALHRLGSRARLRCDPRAPEARGRGTGQAGSQGGDRVLLAKCRQGLRTEEPGGARLCAHRERLGDRTSALAHLEQ